MDYTGEVVDSETCLSCLECCKYLRFDYTVRQPEIKAELELFYTVRGCSVTTVKNQGRPDWSLYILVPSVCPHLTSLGCAIYEHRPRSCRAYDGLNDITIRHLCKRGKK